MSLGQTLPDKQKILTDAAKSLLISQLKKQIMAGLVKRLAFFAMPIVNPVMTFVIGWVLEIALEKTVLGLNLLWIEIENEREKKAYEDAFEDLKKLPEDPDPEELERQRRKFEDAARDLIRIRTKRL